MKHKILLFALTICSATCFAQIGTGIFDASQLGFDTAVSQAVAAANSTNLGQTVILPMGHTYTTNGVDTTTSPSGACVNIEGYETSELPGGVKFTVQYVGAAGGTAIKHTDTRASGGCHWSNIIVDCNHLCATAFDSSGQFRFYAENLSALNCTGDCVIAGQVTTPGNSNDYEQFWNHLQTGLSGSGTVGAGAYALVVNATDSRFYDVRAFGGSTCAMLVNHGANVFYDFHPQPGTSGALNCGFEDHSTGIDFYGLECDTTVQYCGKFYGHNSHVIGGRAVWNGSYNSTGALLWYFDGSAANNTVRSFSCTSYPTGTMQFLYNVSGTNYPTTVSGLPTGTTVEQLNSCNGSNVYNPTTIPTIYGKTQNVM